MTNKPPLELALSLDPFDNTFKETDEIVQTDSVDIIENEHPETPDERITKALNTLDDALHVMSQNTKSGGRARDFEVLNQIAMNIIQSSIMLKRDTENPDREKTVNNNLFVGNTEDLRKLLKQNKDE